MIQRLSLDVWLHREGLSGWTTRGIPGWIDRGFSRLVCLNGQLIPLRSVLELINLDVTSWLMTIIKDIITTWQAIFHMIRTIDSSKFDIELARFDKMVYDLIKSAFEYQS